MVGEVVTHVRFGRGIVTAFTAPRIEIAFDDGAVKTFAYPLSAKRFLRFERTEAQRQAERDCEQAEVIAREREQAMLEEKRRKAEEEAVRRIEAQREKKAAAAKRSAAMRKTKTTTGGKAP